ncbi:MAG: GNAT family N-acetyltransferase [Gammaproteobacteria bacterium]|nr:GNAT family N-acetyltransferase [Gammaproteobacteria bacterium]
MMIRDAHRADIAVWSQMRTDLWPDTDDGHLAQIDAYFARSSTDIVQVFVAETAADVVGFLELNIRNFAEGSRSPRLPYVEAWYVKPQHRGQGYGGLLMQRAEDWAAAEGYTELASDTELDNERSIAVHKHLGFVETERIVCFLKRLKDA